MLSGGLFGEPRSLVYNNARIYPLGENVQYISEGIMRSAKCAALIECLGPQYVQGTISINRFFPTNQ